MTDGPENGNDRPSALSVFVFGVGRWSAKMPFIWLLPFQPQVWQPLANPKTECGQSTRWEGGIAVAGFWQKAENAARMGESFPQNHLGGKGWLFSHAGCQATQFQGCLLRMGHPIDALLFISIRQSMFARRLNSREALR